MSLGETFDTTDDAGQPVTCEVVFTGGMSLFRSYWPCASSLQGQSASQQPAKGRRGTGRSTPCASSQTSLRV